MRAIERAKIRKVGQTKAEVDTWQVTNIPKVVNTGEAPLGKGKRDGFTLNKKNSDSVSGKMTSWQNAVAAAYLREKDLKFLLCVFFLN